jgi:CubicO group peptidase (beta-lactamase class C family)
MQPNHRKFEGGNVMFYTSGTIDCTPAEAGYDESRIQVLHKHFEKLMDSGKIVCASYCVSRRGKVFMHGALGPISYKDGETRAYKPDDIQYIASITKIFAAVAFMKLVEDGLVRLDTPVGRILPQFDTPPFNNITAFHLLTHTSGMYPDDGVFESKHYMGYWRHISRYIKNYKPEDGEFDWLSAALAVQPRKKIGEEWQYCSFGSTVIGAMIEKLLGMKVRDYIIENITKPLGMNHTAFDLTPEMAKNHVIQSERSEGYLNDIINGKEPDEENKLWEKVPHVGSGLESNVRDLITFGNMLLNKGSLNGVRIIGRKMVEKMTTRAIFNTPNYCWGANDPDRVFGIGFDMRQGPAFSYSEGTFNHEGAGASALYMDPKEEMAAAFFVPFKGDGWHDEALFNTLNIIWSGLI